MQNTGGKRGASQGQGGALQWVLAASRSVTASKKPQSQPLHPPIVILCPCLHSKEMRLPGTCLALRRLPGRHLFVYSLRSTWSPAPPFPILPSGQGRGPVRQTPVLSSMDDLTAGVSIQWTRLPAIPLSTGAFLKALFHHRLYHTVPNLDICCPLGLKC